MLQYPTTCKYISKISYSDNILQIGKMKKEWKHTQITGYSSTIQRLPHKVRVTTNVQEPFHVLPFFGSRCHGPLHSGEALILGFHEDMP